MMDINELSYYVATYLIKYSYGYSFKQAKSNSCYFTLKEPKIVIRVSDHLQDTMKMPTIQIMKFSDLVLLDMILNSNTASRTNIVD